MQSSQLELDTPESFLPQYHPNEADRFLLAEIMICIHSGELKQEKKIHIDKCFTQSSFPKKYNRLAITIYAAGFKRVMIVRRATPPFDNFSQVLARVFRFPRLAKMSTSGLRLQLDFIEHPPEKIDYWRVGSSQSGRRHFEPGIDGLRIEGTDKVNHFFLPGDAFVRSIMSMKQLRQYMNRTLGEDYMRSATVERFNSDSFISYHDDWLRLYRGYPTVGGISRKKLEKSVNLAIKHIQHNQEEDGRFLYYYDAATNSRRDHEHLSRDPVSNPYYNILRHGGGGLTCLFYEKLYNEGETLTNIKKSLDYLVSNSRDYELDGNMASYIFYNRKAKLGGTGIALYLASEYQLLTGDSHFFDWAKRLAHHLQGEILPSGEFRYYHIYLDQLVKIEDNQKYFSFYYPGEAICGLARYYNIATLSEHQNIAEKLHLALIFLLEVRPNTRAEHYTRVPSDSWLMMGINEIWKIEQLRRPAYAQFVFSDADKMIEQMYQVFDAPYPDYVGAFYYEYGDYPYADGARCEGLLAAYQLAGQMGDSVRMKKYWQALLLAAWSLYHLVNTEESIYSVPNPKLSLGGIRFKYTRQWFRIDTIQHVASFFAKMLPYWHEESRQG